MTGPLRTLIADDEPLALDLLDVLLRDHPLIEIVARCASGQAVLDRLADTTLDLLVLDIEMPGVTGIEVARRADLPMVIFATAHADFAVDAFEADAVDYVLKPLDAERLRAAVEKASVQRPFRLAGVGRALVPATPRETLPVKEGGRTVLVPITEIVWAEGAGDYALLHTKAQVHTARVTLRDLERELERAGFLRVHRSAIVRVSCVRAVTALPKGEAMLVLEGGAEVKASRTYRAAIQRLIGGL